MDTTSSVEYLQIIVNYLKSEKIDIDKIYRQSGLDISLFKEPGARIPLLQFHAFWNAAIKESKDPNIGFHLGKNILFFSSHLFFLILSNCSTIKEVIKKTERYSCLLSNFFNVNLSSQNNLAEMVLQYNILEHSADRHSNESYITAFASMLKHLSNDKICFKGVYFVHSQPEDISEYLQFFKAPLYFNQKENKLVFDRKFLGLPVPLSNQNILESLEKIAQGLQKKICRNESWSQKVINMLFHFIGKEKPKLELIAGKLSTTPRNLQKKLKKEHVTYQSLLDYTRLAKAKYLLEKRCSVNEIAFLLGYSEQSVFNKAFRRWVGASPLKYRNQF